MNFEIPDYLGNDRYHCTSLLATNANNKANTARVITCATPTVGADPGVDGSNGMRGRRYRVFNCAGEDFNLTFFVGAPQYWTFTTYPGYDLTVA